jgi:hypothetical protein
MTKKLVKSSKVVKVLKSKKLLKTCFLRMSNHVQRDFSLMTTG